jgi:hypothetical protein
LVVALAGCGPTITPIAAVSPGVTPASIASAPRISDPPVRPPTPPGNDLPAFACKDYSGGTAGAANTIAVRMAEQAGYDRFVLQLDSIVPTFTVKRQSKPVFTQGATGQALTLVGTAGVLVQVHSATGSTFTGSTDIVHPEFTILQEARQTQDFEGYVSWGLGLSRPACMRVFTLADPARLVVDFQTTTS